MRPRFGSLVGAGLLATGLLWSAPHVTGGPSALLDAAGATTAPPTPPPVNADADYQLGGAYKPPAGVTVVTRDRTARPAGHRYNICYVNAFQTQPEDRHWWKRHHRALLLRHHGKLVHDPGWPGEILLDTSTAANRRALDGVLGGWVAQCGTDGFDAVEPDNLDSFTRSHHELTRADNLAFVRLLARDAHQHGLAIAQKNTAGLSSRQISRIGFDFAVAEDCQVYHECGRYKLRYGGHVIEVEYADEGWANYRKACRARGDRWSIVYRDRQLRPSGAKGYKRAAC